MDRTNGRTERYGKVRADLTYFDAAPEFVNEPDPDETADDPDPPCATATVAGETPADGIGFADNNGFGDETSFAGSGILAGEKVSGKKETVAEGSAFAGSGILAGEKVSGKKETVAEGSAFAGSGILAGEKVSGKKETGREDKPTASEKSAEWLDPALAVCPFFVQAMRRGVVCEGLAERSELRTRFRSVPDRNAHYERYCCSFSGCGTCPVARAIMHVKYADCEWFRAETDPGTVR